MKTQSRIQWAAVLGAVVVGAQQLAQTGAIQPEHAVYVLVATNILSALLPGLLGKPEVKQRGGK